jgi:hypothetical protein
MRKIVLYEGAKAAEGADIALKAKLFVSGWELSKELQEIRKSAHLSLNEYSVAIAFNGEIPVTAVIRFGTTLQAFCKASERRKGNAQACVWKIKKAHPELEPVFRAAEGVQGSTSFWNQCLVRVAYYRF